MEISYDDNGLVPVVIQDWTSGEVLTLAYANAESLALTRETGELHLWSRSRNELWHKGATSGNVQKVRALRIDCDGDAILALVEPAGPACHTGARTCFHNGDTGTVAPHEALPALERTLRDRAQERPAGSYTVALLDDPPLIGAKVMEEAEEVARAAREESDDRVDNEAADVIYHLTVLLHSRGRSLADAERVLDERSRYIAAQHHGMVSPSLEEVRELAREHNLIALRQTFIDDLETPVSAFLKLRGRKPEFPSFLLESAEQGQRVGRYSFIGVRPRSVLRWSLGDPGDPYDLAEQAVAAHRQAPLPDLPPFAGGAVGYFGYDLVRTVETTLGPPNEDKLGLPDMALMLSDVLVVFDHLKHTITILVNVYADDPDGVDASYADALATIEKARRLLAGPVPQFEATPPRPRPEFDSNMSREQFEGMVARIIEYVHAGDCFQVVPSQRWSAPLDADPFSVYRGLRVVNPSPYMYFLDFLDFQVAGASPEPLLTVSGSHVSTRPIAGTRKRGADAAEDAVIAQELMADEKERAEHVMLVDLGRNDLGRVCTHGSVAVDTFMAVETYSHVMHIVSNVSGTLREDVTAIDALRSVLPAGTLSGAPKVRAMEIIDELEPVKRGGYGGAVGWLSYTGDLDTCIHIRTIVMTGGHAHVQAGGGTVADARPDYEFEESRAKAAAVLKAVDLALEQPDWP